MGWSRSGSQVRTLAPDFTDPRWLGALGHVANLQWSSTCPGGDSAMQCTLQVPPTSRDPALNPGRRVEIWRGASRVWQGKLNEPQPSVSGWDVQAHGIGTEPADFAAFYQTWNLNDPVDQAISRGLNITNPGIQAGWLSQQADSGSQTVADFLNSVCTPSAQVWMVDQHRALQVGAIPSEVNRFLVTTDPVARSIANDITTVFLKFTASDDGQGNVTYDLTDAFSQEDIDLHGPTEVYADLSNAGVMTAPAAAGVGSQFLARYQRATFAGPFTARPGQYMTTGGSPVDLGCERAGTVARLLVSDGSYGGEAAIGLVEFVTGGYAFDEDSGTAQVTPLQSSRSDFSTLLSLISPGS